jgi:tetratricopeptide (TPR) repeat protein
MPRDPVSRARHRPARARPALTGWRRRLALLLTALLLPPSLLVAVEIALRAGGAGRPTSFFVRARAADRIVTNAQYGWRFFPPALARTPLVAALSSPKPSDTLRVFVLGESAAMGIPEPAFGFSRVLEVMLRHRYPDATVEVVNTAMTAINSHVVRDIARECARHAPDLFLVYMGNNEVVGPFGPATIFTRAAPGLTLIRGRLLVERTRLGQLIARGVGSLAAPPARFTEWRGMEMLTDQQIPEGDPRLETMYRSFRSNLEDVLEAARAAGAPALVATVATNLRDSPPFGSVHEKRLSGAERARWDAARQRGAALRAAGRHADAVDAYREALAQDDGYAELHYELGMALLADGRVGEARAALARARDLDVLRFRADARINDTIREVAARRGGAGVSLVDAERLFAAESAGPPGDDLFWEHVHLNEAGNYLLARAFFLEAVPRLDARTGRSGSAVDVPSADWCAERLALTDWDRLRMASSIFDMTKRPPFTRQLGHAARLASRRQALAALRARARDSLDRAVDRYRRAVAERPDDLPLRVSYATLLRERGRFGDAAAQWRALLERVPGVHEWQSQLAFALADEAGLAAPPDRGMLAEAEAILRGVVDAQPALPAAHVNLGNVLERLGRADEAMREYREALRLHPPHETARFNLAALIAARGDLDGAARLYREALALDPQSAEAHARLGGTLARQQRPGEAIAEYRRAIELDPDQASIRNTLAYALERDGRTADALLEYRAAIETDPDYALARVNLADLLMREGRPAEAAPELRHVLTRQPDHPAALVGLALVLATADAPGVRDAPEAVRLAERAATLTNGAPEVLRVLALAYRAAGRTADAVEAAQRGAAIARARGDARLAAALEEQASRYLAAGRE